MLQASQLSFYRRASSEILNRENTIRTHFVTILQSIDEMCSFLSKNKRHDREEKSICITTKITSITQDRDLTQRQENEFITTMKIQRKQHRQKVQNTDTAQEIFRLNRKTITLPIISRVVHSSRIQPISRQAQDRAV